MLSTLACILVRRRCEADGARSLWICEGDSTELLLPPGGDTTVTWTTGNRCPLPFLFLFWVCLLAGVLAAANAASTAPPRGSNLRVGVFGAVLGADDGADDGADGGADEEAAELPYEISEHPGDDGVDQDDGDGSADVRMLLADVFKPKDVSSKDSPR